MPVKELHIDQRFDHDWLELVQDAEPLVERELGDAANRVHVTWEPGGGDAVGEPTARLRLTEGGVTRTGEFTKWDFTDDRELGWQFRRVWDAVLAERARIQLRQVWESLREGE